MSWIIDDHRDKVMTLAEDTRASGVGTESCKTSITPCLPDSHWAGDLLSRPYQRKSSLRRPLS